MAAIESYLNTRMYDEALNELAKNLADRRQEQEEREADEEAEEQLGLEKKKLKSYLSGKSRASVPLPSDERSQAAYEFPTRQAKRKGEGHTHMHEKSHQSVAAWLSDQDRDTTEKLLVPGMGRKSVYVRQPQARLTKGTWKDRLVGQLSALNNTLPIFSPFSTGRKTWEIFIMALVLYNAASVPLDISYGMPTQGNIVNYMEYSIDLIFAVDICASFRTAYVDTTGHLVRDTNMIAVRYLKTWFAIDVFSTIPYDLLAEAVLQGGQSNTQVTLLKFLRTPRLLRLGRLFRMLDRVKSGNLIRVTMVMTAMTLISHWLACIWFMLYKFTTFADYTEWAIFLNGEIQPDQTISAYLSAYYQSFLMMVGNNQMAYNNIERIFMILVLIMGACFYSAMVGQMAVLVANMNTVALRHRTKQDTTMDVLRYMGLPDKQLARVQSYFTYITQYSHPASEGLSFLSDLPRSLFEELTGFLYGKHLNKVPLFSGLEPSFLASLAARMRIVTFTPREVIFRAGDLGLEMYVIRKGCVAVIGRHQQHLGVLSEGDHFGEIAMFTMAKRTARCVALTNCDLCVLNTYDLKMVMKDFPTSSQALQEKAEEELRQLQLAGRAGVTDDDEEDAEYGDSLEEEQQEEDLGSYQEEPEGAEDGSRCGSSTTSSRSSQAQPLQNRGSLPLSSDRSTLAAGDPDALQVRTSGRPVRHSSDASNVPQSQGMSDTASQEQQPGALPRRPSQSPRGGRWAPLVGGPIAEGNEDEQASSPSHDRVISQHHVTMAQRLAMRGGWRQSVDVRISQWSVHHASAVGEAQESPRTRAARASSVGSLVSAGSVEAARTPIVRKGSSQLVAGALALQDDPGGELGRSVFLTPSKSGRSSVNGRGSTRTSADTTCMQSSRSSGATQERSVQRQPSRAAALQGRRSSAEQWMQTTTIRTSAEFSYIQNVCSSAGVEPPPQLQQSMRRIIRQNSVEGQLQRQPSVRTSAELAYINTKRSMSTKKSLRSSAEGAGSTCASVENTYNGNSAEQTHNRSSVDPAGNHSSVESTVKYSHHRSSTEAANNSVESTMKHAHHRGSVDVVSSFANYNALEHNANHMEGLRTALFTHTGKNATAAAKQGRGPSVVLSPHEQQLAKALAASQQQVQQLQGELSQARAEAQQGSQSRSELFTQVASLLQLIEALGIRIAGLEDWVGDTDRRLAKMETQGANNNILGTNLEMAGPAFAPHSMRHKSGMAPAELGGSTTLRSQVSMRRRPALQPGELSGASSGGGLLRSQASMRRKSAIYPSAGVDTSMSGGTHRRRPPVNPSGDSSTGSAQRKQPHVSDELREDELSKAEGGHSWRTVRESKESRA